MKTLTFLTLGTRDLDRTIDFHADAFGWSPSFRTARTAMVQMPGMVVSVFLWDDLAADMAADGPLGTGAIALAHNVRTEAELAPLLDRMVAAGGRMLRAADAPPHGGPRGYAAGPDGHPWEIACHPALIPDAAGRLGPPR